MVCTGGKVLNSLHPVLRPIHLAWDQEWHGVFTSWGLSAENVNSEGPPHPYKPAWFPFQARSYVQAWGGSCLLVPRCLNFFETQINVMRNCVKRKKIWQKVVQTCCCCAATFHPYVVTCNIFDQLILRNFIKIVATRCQILTLKCSKIDFGWGSAPDPFGGAYSAPQTP